jgi:hypothetical protein
MKLADDRHIRSGFAPVRSACRWAAVMPRQGRWYALAEAEVAGRLGSQLRKKFLFQPPLELATVAPWVSQTLLEASAWSCARCLPRFAPEGNLRAFGSGDGGAICVFFLLGGIVLEPTSALEPKMDGMLLAGDVACSLATMMSRAKFGFSCAPSCRCGVGAMVECPCGNDDGNRWPLEDSVGASHPNGGSTDHDVVSTK